ncbi:MAG TPA: oligosaccharide flippase family protein [Chloroflexota bacterium]|nr:oligosaccharide flippase family protein [Chloroflexota bacterium]
MNPSTTSPNGNLPGGTLISKLTAAPRRLLGRRFAREVLTLQVGSFATMGIQFVTSVVIANLLGPHPLGIYYQAKALLDLVNMLANLAVGQALITPLAAAHTQRNRDEARCILAYFLKMGLTVSFVTSAVGLLAGNYLGAIFLDDPQIGDMARVLFVTPPLLVIFNMATLALQSSRQVGRLTLLENGYLMSTSLLNVAVVALGGGVNELLYSVSFAALLTAVASLWMYSNALSKMPSFPTLMEIAKSAPGIPFRRYFVFSALVSVDKNFANLISLAPTILLGRWGTSADVAYYKVAANLTVTLLSVPMSPVSRNLYAKLAEVRVKAPQRLGRMLVQVTLGSLAISGGMALGLMLAAPFIIQIYRPDYLPALGAMYALGVRCATLGFGVGLGPLYQVLGKMKLAILSKVPPALVMLVGGWFLIPSLGAVGGAWTVTLTYLVGDIISACLMWWILTRNRAAVQAAKA